MNEVFVTGREEMGDSTHRYAFTVFTATYNRAHTLRRVYDSLREQTFRDFEWLIVDDGSTDGTRALVASWRHSWFPIRYLFQENAGKHVAMNRGAREALGELFLSVDSDDALVPHALERFSYHWASIPASQKERFSAVTGRCMDQRGRLVGERLPRDVMDSDSLEMYFNYKVPGDKFGFHRTDVLRAHPFPEPSDARFVSESIVWFAIARTHKTRYVDEPLLTVYRGRHPARDNLSTLTRTTAYGRLLFHKTILNDYGEYLSSSPSRFFRSLINYCRYSFVCDIGLVSQFTQVVPRDCKVALAAVLPLGYLLSLRDAVALRRSPGRTCEQAS